MSDLIPKAKRHVEYLILGSDLTAQLIGESLRQRGASVEIIDERLPLGGLSVPIVGQRGWLASKLEFLPDLQTMRSQVTWLSDLLQTEIRLDNHELRPLTFEEGQLKPFYGFGSREFNSLDEVTPYAKEQILEMSPSPSEMVLNLIEKQKLPMHGGKTITHFFYQNRRIAAIELNGNEVWSTNFIVSTLAPSRLLALLPNEAVETKTRAKIEKAPLWNTVSLHLSHRQPVQEQTNMHILLGGGQDYEPVIGRFFAPTAQGTQHSIWMSFVRVAHAEDHDFSGQVVKHIKKQVKRAYENLFENLVDEKLVVVPQSHGSLHLKTKTPFVLPEIENLYWAHPALSEQKGIQAQLDIAHQLTNI